MFNTFKLTHQLQTRYFFLNSDYPISYFLVFHWRSSHFFHPLMFLFLLNNRIKFFMTYSMSINAWDTKVSMLSSLLLANIRILSCFLFLFLVMLSNFLIIPVVTEKNWSKTWTCYSNWCSNNTCKQNDANSTTCCT